MKKYSSVIIIVIFALLLAGGSYMAVKNKTTGQSELCVQDVQKGCTVYSEFETKAVNGIVLSGGNDSMSMDGYGNNSGEDIAGGIWKHVPAGV